MDFDETNETITPTRVTYLSVAGTGGVSLPAGTTAQRPGSPPNGVIRYNSTTSQPEFYQANGWQNHLPVVITAPVSTQIISYNGTNWINTSVAGASATGTIGTSPSGGGTAWTLISGQSYRADFVHNLGTTNVVVTLWDTSNNSVVIANSLVTQDANTVRITVIGNTKTIKVVVVANGTAIAAGGSTDLP
jgi:hypothetical protein